MRQAPAPSHQHRIRDDYRDEENKPHMDMINAKSHFNFLKMHLLSHFCDNIHQFDNIPMYSTEIGGLAHKTQIKQRWRQLNKNDAACQIGHSYCHQHAIRMKLLNLESLQDSREALSADVLKHLDTTTHPV